MRPEMRAHTYIKFVRGNAINSPLIQLCGDKMMRSSHEPALFMMKHMSKDVRIACKLAESLGHCNRISRTYRNNYQESEVKLREPVSVKSDCILRKKSFLNGAQAVNACYFILSET